MTDASNYEGHVQSIRGYNQPILATFEAWLEQSGLTQKTVKALDKCSCILARDLALKTLNRFFIRKAGHCYSVANNFND